jgi:hypothetical protein
MKVITIRDGVGTLVAFGPDNGMYEPVVPVGCVKAVERDYEPVKAEWLAKVILEPKPKTIEERVSALERAPGRP